ncbi:hypothetical protein K8O68_03900 [Salipaludibacillus sp. CUR1]|uniref:hypothetical protein n=1 Tax=Salipaludibacillus sp. CUR1 TaxID=2820003 RepID=UPI001E5ECDC2|nr:hypothetical protein [Salipaludibacillus sp. CUR1]MCE7791569.1 hypothetical protein [Salipaludibacillus sp. CUR1]
MSALSGGLSGLLLTFSVYWAASGFLTEEIRFILFLLIVLVYFIKGTGLINLPQPEVKWQVPPSWVSRSVLGNMSIWGAVLGAGLFTYNPYVSFWLIYVYAGFFLGPAAGFSFGLVYGSARALPSVLYAFKYPKSSLDIHAVITKKIWGKGRAFHLAHQIVLAALLVFLMVR